MAHDDDQLAQDVRTSLRTQASQISIADEPFDPNRVPLEPSDGIGESSAGSNRRRVLIAVAAGVVFVLIAAGAALARGGGDNQAVQTVSPPEGEQPDLRPPTSEIVPESSTTTTEAAPTSVPPVEAAPPPLEEIPVGEVPTTEDPPEDVVHDTLIPPDLTLVSVRLELDATTVVAGGTIAGRVIVSNGSGAPIVVDGCGAFLGGFQSDTLDALPHVACTMSEVGQDRGATGWQDRGIEMPAGDSTWSVQFKAVYAGCMPRADWATPTFPLCLAGTERDVPPLPPGVYRAVVSVPYPLPASDPIEVTIT